ncbi:uncharacterized protein LOC118465659 [Anopheles albimanus]|uniref:uncharacterized protein LOC118465659 n=1 Tax=Anopheles albimanus TaxID=7167 RepID=UPI00163F64B3|nr:uncharacterized protein LOC118465659 [Anopheles albimanus]
MQLISFLAVGFLIGAEAYHIDVNIPNAQSYHDQQDEQNDFKYGYQVENVNEQFHHKRKGDNDVTYGCYGHLDPQGRRHLTLFVADRLGYRPVLPGEPVTVFSANGGTDESENPRGITVQWKDLPLPTACRPSSAPKLRVSVDNVAASSTLTRNLEPPFQSFADQASDETVQSSNDHSVVYVEPPGDQPKSSACDSSLLRPAVCNEPLDNDGAEQTVQLYIPFLVSCSGIEEFQVALDTFMKKFNHDHRR